MKKYLITLAIFLTLAYLVNSAQAAWPVQGVSQGGTGTSTLEVDGLIFPVATTDATRHSQNTSNLFWTDVDLRFTATNASSTNLTVSGNTWLSSVTNALLSTDSDGKIIATTTPPTAIFQIFAGRFNPSDNTNYHYGMANVAPIASALDTSEETYIYIMKDGTIKGARANLKVNSTSTSTLETSTISVRVNDTTNHIISSSVQANEFFQSYTNHSIDIQVKQDDFVQFRWETPGWATNPQSVILSGMIYFE